MYAGCPIVWKSQLQIEIALSSTESDYMGLSYVLWEAIHMRYLGSGKYDIELTTKYLVLYSGGFG